MNTLLVATSRDNPTVATLDHLLRTRFGLARPEVATPDQAESRCHAGEPPVVFVALADERAEACLDVVRRLRAAGAGHLFVVGPATDPKLILKTMQAGADLFLDRDELESELDAALDRLRGGRAERAGQLLAVLSAAGGCGASTVAVNLAAAIAGAHGRCQLIDLNPGKADLAPLLDLTPTYTLADLCQTGDRLDRVMYEKMLVPHRSGVALLAAPREYGEVRAITARGVERAVELGREAFADVVVDLADCFHAEQVSVLERATRVVLVCRLDFTAVRNARRILDQLAALGVSRDRVEVVVNHFGLSGELPVEEAEAALGMSLAHFVPHDPATLFAAGNLGIPAAVTAPFSPVVQSMVKLVGLNTPAAPTQPITARLTEVAGRVRNRLAPRFQALKSRLVRTKSVLAPAVVSDDETADTKVMYESALTTKFRTHTAGAVTA